MWMKMEDPLKCKTKSRAIGSNATEISNVGGQSRLLLGVLQVLFWYLCTLQL
jgi:hypothetical protein